MRNAREAAAQSSVGGRLGRVLLPFGAELRRNRLAPVALGAALVAGVGGGAWALTLARGSPTERSARPGRVTTGPVTPQRREGPAPAGADTARGTARPATSPPGTPVGVDAAEPPLVPPLAAGPAAPRLSPGRHDFGPVDVGRAATFGFRLAARSARLAPRVRVSNTTDYRVASGCPAALRPSASCGIVVTFAPRVAGLRPAVLVVEGAGGVELRAALAGRGRAGPATLGSPQPGGAVFGVGPNAVDFGSVSIGTTATRTIAITGHGPAPLRLTRISLTGWDDFAATDDCPAGLAEGASCVVRVRFAPAPPAGERTGVLRIASRRGVALDVPLRGLAAGGRP